MTAALDRGANLFRRFFAPWHVAAAVLIVNSMFFGPLLYNDGAQSFTRIGNNFAAQHVAPASHRSKAISSLRGHRMGYDGQFSYYIELDPLRARYYTDDPPYRYARILLPIAAWALGAGQPGAFPYTMIAINLFAIVATVYLLAAYLVRHGRSPWWAALYGVFPGMMFCLWADLTEPLGFLLATWGYVAYDRRPERALRYSVLFALAGLARETTLVIPALIAVQIALRGRVGTRLQSKAVTTAATFFGISVIPAIAWRVFLHEWLGGSPFGPQYNWIPFAGQTHHWHFDANADVVLLTVLLPGLAWLALALDRLRAGRPSLPLFMVMASVIFFVILVPSPTEVDYESAGRTITGIVLAVVLWIPDLRAAPRFRPRLVNAGIWLLTLVWFLFVLALGTL